MTKYVDYDLLKKELSKWGFTRNETKTIFYLWMFRARPKDYLRNTGHLLGKDDLVEIKSVITEHLRERLRSIACM